MGRTVNIDLDPRWKQKFMTILGNCRQFFSFYPVPFSRIQLLGFKMCLRVMGLDELVSHYTVCFQQAFTRFVSLFDSPIISNRPLKWHFQINCHQLNDSCIKTFSVLTKFSPSTFSLHRFFASMPPLEDNWTAALLKGPTMYYSHPVACS